MMCHTMTPGPLLLALGLSLVVRTASQGLWPAYDTQVATQGERVKWMDLASREHDKFPGGARCWNWHLNYTQLHKLIKKGSKTWHAKKGFQEVPVGESNPGWRRFATYQCNQGNIRQCGGLGDVLLGVVSTFLVALLQNRAFIIDHPLVLHAFEPNMVDWRLTEDVPQTTTLRVGQDVLPSKLVETQGDTIPGAVVHVDVLNFVPQDMEGFFDPLHEAANLKIRWNRGILTKLLLFDLDAQGGPRLGVDRWTQLLHELGLRLPTAFGCIVKYLLKPKLQIYKMASAQFAQLDEAGVDPGSSICIHVRTPDEQTWDGNGESTPTGDSDSAKEGLMQWVEEKVITCAKKVEAFWFHSPPQVVKWVFLSSSLPLKEAVKKAHHQKVHITDTSPTHTALRRDVPGQVLSFKTATAEWLVYTRCSMYLMTESGFSKTAALYGSRPFSIFLLARRYYKSKRNEWKDVCQPTSPASFTQLGSQWSGI